MWCFERNIVHSLWSWRPLVLRPDPHPAYIDAIGLIMLLMSLFCPCWVWQCDPWAGGNEVNPAAPLPPTMETSRASVLALLALHLLCTISFKSDLFWSDKWSREGQTCDKCLNSAIMGILPNFVMEVWDAERASVTRPETPGRKVPLFRQEPEHPWSWRFLCFSDAAAICNGGMTTCNQNRISLSNVNVTPDSSAPDEQP